MWGLILCSLVYKIKASSQPKLIVRTRWCVFLPIQNISWAIYVFVTFYDNFRLICASF